MPTGRYLTCVGHCAASWKNFTSFHSTPSMETDRRQHSEAQPCPGQPGLPGWVSPGDNACPLTSQHGVLVLGCADEACDPFNDLAFGF